MKILLFGSRGFLGRRFVELFPGIVEAYTDIADAAAVREVLLQERPDIVINAAGKTGRPNVDWCELHKIETVRANVTGPLVLLEECVLAGAKLVHIGSGCMYEGDNGGKGYTEDDPPNFFGSFYSRSKIWSEQVLREFPVLLLRLRMPFDGSDDERNFLTKVSKYTRLLTDQNSMTHLPEFMRAAKILIEKGATGVLNIVNPGTISPYESMEMYRDIVDPAHAFARLPMANLSDVARTGRSNCVLSTEKLAAEGLTLMPIRDAMAVALREIAERKSLRSGL